MCPQGKPKPRGDWAHVATPQSVISTDASGRHGERAGVILWAVTTQWVTDRLHLMAVATG